MHKLFYPERVAVIGVSQRKENMGRNIVENLFRFNFSGELFTVGRSGDVIFGRRMLTSVQELPEGVDLAIILSPAVTVPDIIDTCGRKGIRWVILESGGFSEYSEDGRRLEEELLHIARRWGIRLVGPNGIGIINMDRGLVTPFVPRGGVIFALVNLLASNNIGVSKVVSIGNKLDLGERDFLSYLVEDEETQIIVLYLEGIHNGRSLMHIAKETEKPIIMQKTNIYPSSTQIARFHTAALATDDRVVDAALKGAGIVRARELREVINFIKVFSLPPMRGNNLVIISRSGGIAISACDFAEEYGFRLYPLPDTFLRRVKEAFRAKVITPTNPLDVGDIFDFEFYATITEEVLKEEANGVVFHHGVGNEEEVEASIQLGKTFDTLTKNYQKPIVSCFISSEKNNAYIKRYLDFPSFTEPGEALSALAVSRDHYRRSTESAREEPVISYSTDREKISAILERSSALGRLLLHEAMDIIALAGIKMVPYFPCHDIAEVVARAKELGYPVTLKVDGPSTLHKTDVHGVIVGIRDQDDLKHKFEQLLRVSEKLEYQDGIVLQKCVADGVEMIIGGKIDDNFGPTVLLGFGGVYAEIFEDISLRILPLTEKDAEEMITELRGHPLLLGVRGSPPSDLPFLKEALLRLGQLMIDVPQIKGVDLNPLFLFREGEGGMAADARIVLNEQGL